MLRLLTTEDLEFLLSQPGVTPAMVGQLRRDRCRIFRAYLRTLQDDFGVVCAALKLLLVQAWSESRSGKAPARNPKAVKWFYASRLV